MSKLCVVLLASLAPATLLAVDLEEARRRHAAGDSVGAIAAWHAVAADPTTSASDRATAHNNACVAQSDRGLLEAALADCEAALALRERLDDRLRLARTLNNLGLVLQRLGRLDQATTRFEQALAHNEAIGDTPGAVINVLNLGVVALDQARLRDALEATSDALVRIAAAEPAPWCAEQRLVATINRGAVLERLGAHREALDLYRTLLAQDVDPARRANLLVNTAVMERNLGDPARARGALEEASATFATLDDPAALANAQLNLAYLVDFDVPASGDALALYTTALATARTAGEPAGEALAAAALGDFLRRQGQFDQARQLATLALERSASLPEHHWTGHALLGRIELADGHQDAALESFREAIAGIEVTRAGLGDRNRQQGFFADKLEVYRETLALLVEMGRPEEAFTLAQRAKARELAEAVGSRSDSWPLLEAAAVAALLQPGEVVVELVLVADRIVRFIVRPGLELEVTNLGGATAQLGAAARWRDAIAAGRPAAVPDGLAAVLLGDLDPNSVTTLFVAADGALRSIPLDLLPWGNTTVGDRVVVQLLSSASGLAVRNVDRTTAVTTLVGVGDVPMSSRFALAPLPAAAHEIAQARQALGEPSTLLLGAVATPQALLAAAARGARVVHVAAHAIADGVTGESAIVLAAAAGQDGLLRPSDLANTTWPVDLTVLAACSSGRDGAASLESLSGALLAAGSRAIVATLWDVDDQATAVLMEQFYWELGRGRTAPVALARAKKRLQGDPRWAAPHVWAGFVLIGDVGTLVERRDWTWAIGLAAATAGLALVGLWRWRRRPERTVDR